MLSNKINCKVNNLDGITSSLADDWSIPLFNNIQAVAYHSNIKSRPLMNPKTNQFFRIGEKYLGEDGQILPKHIREDGSYKSGISENTGKPKLFGLSYFKKDAIEGLREGKYSFISTASSLDKGMDIVDLEVAFITGGTCNSIQQTQRGGRVKRLAFNSDKGKALIFNVYVADTRDEYKLKERQKGSKHEIKVLTDLDELIK